MIRFILKRKLKNDPDPETGHSVMETLDVDVPKLEAALKRGGVSQYHYDLTELVGVEIISAADRGAESQK